MSASNASDELMPESPSFRYASTPQRRKRGLSSSLLVTLDLGSLLKGFAAEVREQVLCEGVEYVYPERRILIRDGESCRHRCRYTLRIRDEFMGQMLFTRGYRFKKEELAALELLLAEFMAPLRRALLHRGVIKRRRDSEEDAAARSPAPLDSNTEVAAPPPQQPASFSKVSDLSLVPLGMQGDYPSELLESEPRESEFSPYLWGPDSMYAHAQRDSDSEPSRNRDRTTQTRIAELITRSGISEDALYRRAREVLGYAVYSDDALRIMEKLASAE